jgi:hypothetical protein
MLPGIGLFIKICQNQAVVQTLDIPLLLKAFDNKKRAQSYLNPIMFNVSLNDPAPVATELAPAEPRSKSRFFRAALRVNRSSSPPQVKHHQSDIFKRRCLTTPAVTSRCLQQLAPLPTTAPESAGLCAWRAIGNLIRVTDLQ